MNDHIEKNTRFVVKSKEKQDRKKEKWDNMISW